MSLSNLLAADASGTTGNRTPGWNQFILDHLDYITVRSKTYEIDPTLMNLYRYDLQRFLKVYLKRHEDIAWIVLLLNGLHSDLEFVDITTCVIPDDTLINNLYHSYITIVQNAK